MVSTLISIGSFGCFFVAVIHFFKGWNYYNKMIDELDRKHFPVLFIVPILVFFKGQHNEKGDLYRRRSIKHIALFILFSCIFALSIHTLKAWDATAI